MEKPPHPISNEEGNHENKNKEVEQKDELEVVQVGPVNMIVVPQVNKNLDEAVVQQDLNNTMEIIPNIIQQATVQNQRYVGGPNLELVNDNTQQLSVSSPSYTDNTEFVKDSQI